MLDYPLTSTICLTDNKGTRESILLIVILLRLFNVFFSRIGVTKLFILFAK